jgi:predicted dehydrogenase
MTNRRDFTKTISLGTLGTLTLGAFSCTGSSKKETGPVVWPSDKLNLAFVGINGRGANNIKGLSDQNVVALCDVDWGERSKEMIEAHPKANLYKDYRVMLDKEKNIDGVVISTPDHTHAVITMAAIKAGKHVYCEKPLAHSVYETREITKAAKTYGVQTQMGNQGHSSDTIREFYEMIKAGVIGQVTEVHGWSQNPSGLGTTEPPAGDYKIPKDLDWDLWLGPAEDRAYKPDYLPGRWRKFVDFGSGQLGDFACHTLDPAFWALELGSPESVIATTTNPLRKDKNYYSYPVGSVITLKYPERNGNPPVKLNWYEGGLLPLDDERFKEIEFINFRIGALIVGEKGIIRHGSHGASYAKIYPFDKNAEIPPSPVLLERSKGHHADWVEAIKTGKQASASFDYGGPLTETAMLGIAAMIYPNRELLWDSENMKFTNFDDPLRIIKPEFRRGWSL